MSMTTAHAGWLSGYANGIQHTLSHNRHKPWLGLADTPMSRGMAFQLAFNIYDIKQVSF